MMTFKNIFPFRIGCTSYVIQDEILPNVRMMSDKVDDIELVIFESPGFSNLPDNEEILELKSIAYKNCNTYSVHLPIDQKLAADDLQERSTFLDSVLKITELTRNLPISSYILHLEGLKSPESEEEIQRWTGCVNEFCEGLRYRSDIPFSLFAIENLSYEPGLHESFVLQHGFSNCIDLGHLWLQQSDWKQYIADKITTVGVVHLHGVNNHNRDHLSLTSHANCQEIMELLPILKNYTGVVTIEVFNEMDTFESLHYLKELWQKLF